LTASAGAQANELSVPILNAYPQCEYQVVKVVTSRTPLTSRRDAIEQDTHTKAFRKIAAKLKLLADEASADSIVLTEREVLSNGISVDLVYTAELINSCDVKFSQPIAYAAYNNKGLKQNKLAAGSSIQIEYDITIQTDPNAEFIQPQITNNYVSLEAGAYGVTLGTTYADVIKVFGTPSVKGDLEEGNKLICYGRRHCLTFSDGLLISINSENSIMSTELTNLLSFDERLDDMNWQIDDNIFMAKELPQDKIDSIQNDSLVYSDNTGSLIVSIEKRRTSGKYEHGFIADAYHMSTTSYIETSPKQYASSNQFLAFLQEYLASLPTHFVIADIPFKPSFTSWVSRYKTLYTFGQHIAVVTSGNSVSRIYILDSLFTESHQTTKTDWIFNEFLRGMSIEEALAVAGKDATLSYGQLDIETANSMKRLFFYEQENQMTLYSGEIIIYQ